MKTRILVTGGTGFLGSAVAHRLKGLGYAVTIQGRNKVRCDEMRRQGFTVVQADCTHREAISKACDNQDVIINCAGIAARFEKPSVYDTANTDFVKLLISECVKTTRKQPVKFIYISSPTVYCDLTDKTNISEETKLPKTSVNDCARTKKLCEAAIKDAQLNQNLQAMIFRPRLVYGPGDLKILTRLIEVHEKGPLPLFNDGKARVDLTYIDNFVDAVVLGVESDKGIGHIFNITNGEPLPVIKLLQMLFKELDVTLKTKSVPVRFETACMLAKFIETSCKGLQSLGFKPNPFLTPYTVSIFAKDCTLDISAAQKVLGYQPKINMQEGLKRFSLWHKEHKAEARKLPEKKATVSCARKFLWSSAIIGGACVVAKILTSRFSPG